jgi:hypothetical protein
MIYFWHDIERRARAAPHARLYANDVAPGRPRTQPLFVGCHRRQPFVALMFLSSIKASGLAAAASVQIQLNIQDKTDD